MKDQKLNKLIKISLLGAMAFILMMFEVQLPIFPQFLKLELSDVPALIGAFALGPAAGVGIELLKNILFGVIKGSTSMWVGELANFLVGSILVFTAGIFYKKHKNRAGALIGLAAGTVLMVVLASILNYFVLIPFYAKLLGKTVEDIINWSAAANHYIVDLKALILMGIVPFNILKAVVEASVTMLLYKKISPVLHKEIIHKNKVEA